MASGHFVYVSCQKGRRVDVAHLDDATGDLAPVQSLALPGDGMALAAAPDGRPAERPAAPGLRSPASNARDRTDRA